MVLFLKLLGLFVKGVNYSVQVLKDVKSVLKHLYWLSLLEDDQAISALVQSAINFLI